MKLTKHIRNDLTLAHLVARSGILKNFTTDQLIAKNKNNWLPVHLSKNKNIAQHLFNETIKMISIEDIIIPCIKNNTQSTQTQYGVDLENFLLEQNFTNNEAKVGSLPPTNNERIELALFYLSLIEKKHLHLFDFNPIDLALSHCNSFFFFALNNSTINNEFIDYFSNFKPIIGTDFFIKERAFQIKQQFKQFWNLKLEITSLIPFVHQEKTSDSLKNLEGA